MTDQIDADMRMLLRLAGMVLPEERMPVMRESYARWLKFARILDEPLAYGDEPSVAYRPEQGDRT